MNSLLTATKKIQHNKHLKTSKVCDNPMLVISIYTWEKSSLVFVRMLVVLTLVSSIGKKITVLLGYTFFYISNLVAKTPGLNLGKKFCNLLSNHEVLN